MSELKETMKKTCTKKPSRAQKVKNEPKLSQNQMSELKETQNMKVVQLHEQTPKQYLNPSPTPKVANQETKSKKWPQN